MLVVVVIGFESSTYFVNECDGNLTIGAEIKQGALQREVTVLLFKVQKNYSGKSLSCVHQIIC